MCGHHEAGNEGAAWFTWLCVLSTLATAIVLVARGC